VNITWKSCGTIVQARQANRTGRGWHSLFPQLRTDIHPTLREQLPSGASVVQLFHQSTALITTTSFMNSLFFNCFCESFCVCENP
jgi:hypothetical protein